MATGDVVAAVEQTQTNAFNYGDQAITQAFQYLQDAVATANETTWITFNPNPNAGETLSGLITPFTTSIIPDIGPAASDAYLDDWLEKYNLIMSENFENLFSFGMAESQLEEIFTSGFIIPLNVSSQVTARAFDVESKKSNVLRDQAYTQFAKMGYTIPNGMLIRQIEKINDDYSANISSVNRDLRIKEEDTAVDMMKLALSEALRLKPQCVQIAADFATKYSQMYNFGAENARAYIQGLSVVNDSINAYERNVVTVFSRELDEGRDWRNYDLQDRTANVKVSMDKAEIKTRTALSSADVVARIGQAAVSAQTTISQLAATVAS